MSTSVSQKIEKTKTNFLLYRANIIEKSSYGKENREPTKIPVIIIKSSKPIQTT
jgi:hypothetical protein